MNDFHFCFISMDCDFKLPSLHAHRHRSTCLPQIFVSLSLDSLDLDEAPEDVFGRPSERNV